MKKNLRRLLCIMLIAMLTTGMMPVNVVITAKAASVSENDASEDVGKKDDDASINPSEGEAAKREPDGDMPGENEEQIGDEELTDFRESDNIIIQSEGASEEKYDIWQEEGSESAGDETGSETEIIEQNAGNKEEMDGSEKEPLEEENAGEGADDVHEAVHGRKGNSFKTAADEDIFCADFKMQKFAAYAIAGIGIGSEMRTHTFAFYIGTDLYQQVILKEGEELKRPENPVSADGSIFAGWYEDEAFLSEFSGFGQTAVMDDETTRLYAKFEDAYVYVFYHDADDSILKTVQVKKNSMITISASYPEVRAADTTISNSGWATSKGSEESVVGDYLAGEENIDLYPILKKGAWLIFDSQGGSSVAPEFVPYNGTPVKPEAPTRIGYDFKGWYIDEGYSEEFDFDGAVTDDVTVYAKWEAEKVPVTVHYWFEHADDDDYSLDSSYDKTIYAPSGTTVVGADYPLAKNNVPGYFHINGTGKTIVVDSDTEVAEVNRNNTKVTVRGDGSAVLNVYYDRNSFLFIFRLGDQGNKEVARFAVKYGENIYQSCYLKSQALQEAVAEGNERNCQWFSESRGANWRTLFWFPSSGTDVPTNFQDGQTEYKTRKVAAALYNHIKYYYFEKLPGDTEKTGPEISSPLADEIIDSDGVIYDTYVRYDMPSHKNWTNGMNYNAVQGFTLQPEKAAGYATFWKGSGNPDFIMTWNYLTDGSKDTQPIYQYFKRNQYSLLFDAQGGDTPTRAGIDVSENMDIYYQQEINSFAPDNYTEQTTKDVDGMVYSFKGWFDANGKKYDFGKGNALRMPAEDLVLYAKWEPVRYTVTFDANGGVW